MIYWYFSSEPPLHDRDSLEFLAPEEQAILTSKRFPKRRSEWVHGRLVAKTLIAHCHPQAVGRPIQDIIIRNETRGAPYGVLQDGTSISGCLSVSHSCSLAVAALSLVDHLRVGIDLEAIAPRPTGFFENYFTGNEIDYVRAGSEEELRSRLTLIWSAKESVLKAMRIGLAKDTRQIDIIPQEKESDQPPSNSWNRYKVNIDAGMAESIRPCSWLGWWKFLPGYILTVAACSQDVELYQRLDRSVPFQVA
jgi:4'-phosphopantetheinyl transferase